MTAVLIIDFTELLIKILALYKRELAFNFLHLDKIENFKSI